MVKPKAQSNKQKKRGGIDFKKIKRKVGRKLPPPKNATNTEIKSKAIILPEQSVVSDKAGLAVSKKGLTLKELLQQTSHYNAKVRKDALVGIKDIFLKNPTELKLHKLATVEKLRERISDDDKLVRETLYQLFKSVVLPGCKEDNQGPLISLLVAYIFNSMTHLSIDVRLMAFKFFDLVVQHYPSSFSLYAEKILQNYHDILQKSQFHFQDKSKLKGVLAGLVQCLRLLPCNQRVDHSSSENEVPSQGNLHAFEPDDNEDSSGLLGIVDKLKGLLPVLLSCFQDYILSNHTMPLLDAHSFDCMLFILQSIDHMVEFFVLLNKEARKGGQGVQPLHERGPHTVLLDQIISTAILRKLWDVFPLNSSHHHLEKEDDRYFILNGKITEIFLQLKDWSSPPPALLESFLGFIESSLLKKSSICGQTGRIFLEKHLLPLVPFIPNLATQVSGEWRYRILQAFTHAFQNCRSESHMKFTCLSALGEMLDPEEGWLLLAARDPEMLKYQLIWIRMLPQLLGLVGDKDPLCSKAILRLLLLIGKAAKMNFSLSQEYDQVQYALADFFSTFTDDRNVCYGPFMRLAQDIQELSLSCLFYFSFLDSPLLQSLMSCCLCQDLEPLLLFRITEVLHSSYKAGNISNGDYISFLITLISRFKVSPVKHDGSSSISTFRSISSFVCSCLSQIGDDYLVLQMLETLIIDQMSLELPLDNICASLRVLIALDKKPTRLCERSVVKLSRVLLAYMAYVAISFEPENDSRAIISKNESHYYLLPCFFLFDRSSALLDLFLASMRSVIEKSSSLFLPHHASSKLNQATNWIAIVSVLLLLHEDYKMRQILLPYKSHVESVIQSLLVLKTEDVNLTIEERHKVQSACDRLLASLSR